MIFLSISKIMKMKVTKKIITVMFAAMWCSAMINFAANQQTKPAFVYETEFETETEVETETELEPMAYTEEELYALSHIISAEAEYCQLEMMEGVGSVVLNRVADDRFPDTIEDVIHQPGQYEPVSNGIYDSVQPSEMAVEVAIDLLEYGSKFPPEVIYQANFPQGNGTYLTLSTSYSTMFFCY